MSRFLFKPEYSYIFLLYIMLVFGTSFPAMLDSFPEPFYVLGVISTGVFGAMLIGIQEWMFPSEPTE